jgi:predicted DNA-binding protein YlxM (UPF0122 family)
MSDFVEEAPEKLPLEEIANRLRGIEGSLRENLQNLHEQVLAIQSKPELLSRLKTLRNDMVNKANSLEADVNKLQEDVKKMREALGVNMKKQNTKNC